MIKIIYRSFFNFIILLLILIVYLSTNRIKTDKFNSKIISQIDKKIEQNFELKIKRCKCLNWIHLTLE